MCCVLISEISETPKTDRRFLTELLFSLYTNVLLLESSNKSKYIEVKHSEFSDFKILRHLGENVTFDKSIFESIFKQKTVLKILNTAQIISVNH